MGERLRQVDYPCFLVIIHKTFIIYSHGFTLFVTKTWYDKTIKESEFDFLRETQTTSRLNGNEEDGYSLELLVLNGEQTVFGITLSVASKEAALIMRSNWESKSGELYDSIWNTLYHPSDEE